MLDEAVVTAVLLPEIRVYLRLAPESVRPSPAGGRQRYAAFDGSRLGTRAELRTRLVADGWLIG
jgi:hypothetical protein